MSYLFKKGGVVSEGGGGGGFCQGFFCLFPVTMPLFFVLYKLLFHKTIDIKFIVRGL